LKAYHKGWVEEHLCDGKTNRDDKWTRSIAVGSKGFVEHVESRLGALAKGRKPREAGEGHHLGEARAPYGDHFGVKKGDMGVYKAYLSHINPE